MTPFQYTRADDCITTGTYDDEGRVEGTVTVTFPSGVIHAIKEFSHNIPVGTHTIFNAEGDPIEVIKYSDDGEITSINGVPQPPIEEE